MYIKRKVWKIWDPEHFCLFWSGGMEGDMDIGGGGGEGKGVVWRSQCIPQKNSANTAISKKDIVKYRQIPQHFDAELMWRLGQMAGK